MPSKKRAVAAIAGGTVGGQLIALLCSPLLSRLVPPASFGPFAVVNAAVMPVATVAAWRLEMAIPLPEPEDEALDIARAGLIITGAMGALGLALAWLLQRQLAHAMGLGGNPALLCWIPVIATAMGAYTVLNQLAIRWRLYGAIGRRNLLQAGATAVGQVIFGAVGWGANGLALGLAVGQVAGVIALGHGLRGMVHERSGRARVGVREVVARHRRFPLLLAPSGLINSLGLQAPLLLVAAWFGTTVSGWLGMTQRILALPVALIGLAMSQVFLGEFSAARRKASRSLRSMFLRTSRQLSAMGIVIAVVVMVLAPWAFALVLGSQWRTSGVYAQALAFGLMIQMVASPLSQTLIVMGRIGRQALWDCSRLLVCCGAVCIGHFLNWTAVEAIIALGFSTAVSYLGLWLLAWRAVASFGVESNLDSDPS